ncbi:hypothetical protein HK405_006120, partial [Cladochytrium tenue]
TIDGQSESHFRRAVFDRYYRGRMFGADLPSSWWPLVDTMGRTDDPRPARNSWPPAGECGKPGGAVAVEGDAMAPSAKFRIRKPATSSGSVLPPGSRAAVNAMDFSFKQITTFFSPSERDNYYATQNYPRGKWFVYESHRVDILPYRLQFAGASGWKAFAVCLYACFDPAGRLDTLVHYRHLVPDVAADDQEMARRIGLASELIESGWKPTDSALPLHKNVDTSSAVVTHDYALILARNVEIAPGFVVLRRIHRILGHGDGEVTDIGWKPFFGTSRSSSFLDECKLYDFHSGWTVNVWNRYWRLMFLCHDDEAMVDFHSFWARRWDSFKVAGPQI